MKRSSGRHQTSHRQFTNFLREAPPPLPERHFHTPFTFSVAHCDHYDEWIVSKDSWKKKFEVQNVGSRLEVGEVSVLCLISLGFALDELKELTKVLAFARLKGRKLDADPITGTTAGHHAV